MKRIALVAGSERTARALRAQLVEYLGGLLEIEACWTEGPRKLSRPPEGDFLLASSPIVLAELGSAGLLPPGMETLAAERSVDPARLEEVVALAPGSPVLFVNDCAETARECVDSLLSLGLDYLEWLPWHPGLPKPSAEYRTAVVAGEPDLVPSGVPELIDIGPRIFDFGTLAELFRRLGLPDRVIGGFSRRYLAKIVSLARSLARSTEEARRLSDHLGLVLESLGHGILVYDAAGRVSVCSEEARALLGLRSGNLSGATLAGLVRNKELLDFLESQDGGEAASIRLPEGSVAARRFGLGDGEHWVATLRDEEECGAEEGRRAREYRRRGHVAKWTMEDIVGESAALQRAKRIAARLAATDLAILIHGESGTGKELFASAIHAASGRSGGPFLAVDLGALSDDLIESELFGYEEGAFTGAKKGGKAGLFELADGGTLFLDEIGNVSPKVQRRLLRVLQEKEVLRVGGAEIKRVDVRIIAASNEDLYARALRGEFREDLYFRLKMGWLRIPPLRERREDIPLLIRRFLALEAVRDLAIEETVLETLAARDWPGNVRELRNTLTYMLAVREGEGIGPRDMPEAEYFAEEEGVTAPNLPGASVEGSVGDGGLEPADRAVLAALVELEAAGRSGSRLAVAERCAARGFELGSGAVRTRFERLAALGLLSSRRGRGGTRLTSAGRRSLV